MFCGPSCCHLRGKSDARMEPEYPPPGPSLGRASSQPFGNTRSGKRHGLSSFPRFTASSTEARWAPTCPVSTILLRLRNLVFYVLEWSEIQHFGLRSKTNVMLSALLRARPRPFHAHRTHHHDRHGPRIWKDAGHEALVPVRTCVDSVFDVACASDWLLHLDWD